MLANRNAISAWLFDLDNTLYSPHSEIFPQIHVRMESYIMRHFNIDAVDASKRREDYFYQYGTSLRGLMVEEKVDPQHFLDYVHDVDYGVIAPDPQLKNYFTALKGKKYIFTNADRAHALRVLKQLQLEEFFDGIFDIADGDYVCKPDPAPYQQLITRFGLAPTSACMIDDMQQNLRPAADMGMTTIWLRHEAKWLRHKPLHPSAHPHCHYAADDLIPLLKSLTENQT